MSGRRTWAGTWLTSIMGLATCAAPLNADEFRQLAQVVGTGGQADERQGLDVAPAELIKLAEREKARDPRVRYVLANLKLAKLNLRTVIEAKQRAPEEVTTTELQRVRQAYNLAVTELRNVMQARRGNGALEQAEAAVKLARSNLDKSLAARQADPVAVDDAQLERLQLALEMAEAQLAIQQSTGDVRSVMAEMQQRLNQLTREVAELRRQLSVGARLLNSETRAAPAGESPALPTQ
jgi:hypothetical protein